jgi:transcriptional regulator with XRE-family HTH domain
MDRTNRLDAWRIQKKLTCSGLGKRVGADHSQISRICAGKRGPGRDLAVRIQVLTGIPITYWSRPSKRRTASPKAWGHMYPAQGTEASFHTGPEVTCSADIVRDSSSELSSAQHQADALAPLAARWVTPAEPNIPPLLGLALTAVVIVGLAWGACEVLRWARTRTIRLSRDSLP